MNKDEKKLQEEQLKKITGGVEESDPPPKTAKQGDDPGSHIKTQPGGNSEGGGTVFNPNAT